MPEQCQTFQAVFPGGEIKDVDGTSVKLKGFSKFTFFEHKQESEWSVREALTGRRLSSDTNQRKARSHAKAYLLTGFDGDLKKIQKHIEENKL